MSRDLARSELLRIMPERMRARPLDARGYPVPWFVAYIDGKPDFRVIGVGKFQEAVGERLCWLCGNPLGRYFVFVLGPMCMITRTSSEPPAHQECAKFAVRACPFLVHPNAQRRDANLPANGVAAPGVMLPHNPTCSALWTTDHYATFRVSNGVLLKVGEPRAVSVWHRGRLATRDEALDAIHIGLPALRNMALNTGSDATNELEGMLCHALKYLPPPVEHA
jgi:hypothetical protein